MGGGGEATPQIVCVPLGATVVEPRPALLRTRGGERPTDGDPSQAQDDGSFWLGYTTTLGGLTANTLSPIYSTRWYHSIPTPRRSGAATSADVAAALCRRSSPMWQRRSAAAPLRAQRRFRKVRPGGTPGPTPGTGVLPGTLRAAVSLTGEISRLCAGKIGGGEGGECLDLLALPAGVLAEFRGHDGGDARGDPDARSGVEQEGAAAA